MIAILLLLVAAANASAATGFPFTAVAGSPFATDEGPVSAVFNPSGSLLATANYLAGDVSMFALNGQTNALAPAPGSPYTAGNGPDSVAFDPSGTLLAVSNLVDGTVSVFSVTASSGALTEVPGSPFTTGDEPRSVSFSPSGSLLAVANAADSTVSVFSVDGTDGALTQVPGSPFSSGAEPIAVAFSPSGSLLAVADEALDAVIVFSVNGSTGALTQAAGSPFATGNEPDALAFDPRGGLLAVADGASDAVTLFSVSGSSGALTQVPGSPFATGSEPLAISFSADGNLLATANAGSGDVSVFSVQAATGSLAASAYSPLSAGNQPRSVAFGPAPDLLAVANRSDSTVDLLAPAVPTATITWPSSGGTYAQGEQVATDYACAENAAGPGLASCSDSEGTSNGEGWLNTSAPGTYTYQVTALSEDGLTSAATVTYAVLAVPAETGAPVISGAATPGDPLQCSQGSWTEDPTGFSYQWSRNGVPIQGADQSTYAVQAIDEGSTLTCAVTATNGAGTGAGTVPASVAVPVPRVKDCPGATGRLSGKTFGTVALGDARSTVRALLRDSSLTRTPYIDVYCFTPADVRVGYATPTLLHALRGALLHQTRGRVVWVASADPAYSAQGITPGATLAAAQASLQHGSLLSVHGTSVYLVPLGGATVMLSARDGIVSQIGIATRQITAIPAARQALIQSFL